MVTQKIKNRKHDLDIFSCLEKNTKILENITKTTKNK